MADFHNNKPKRKKVCFMCIGKDVNYKNVEIISKYITKKIYWYLCKTSKMYS